MRGADPVAAAVALSPELQATLLVAIDCGVAAFGGQLLTTEEKARIRTALRLQRIQREQRFSGLRNAGNAVGRGAPPSPPRRDAGDPRGAIRTPPADPSPRCDLGADRTPTHHNSPGRALPACPGHPEARR